MDSKTELDAPWNEMHLYAANGKLDRAEFVALCHDTKANAKSGRFTFAVVFDDPEFARFPDNPFTGLFGSEETIRHVFAIFEHNSMNGFTEATIYDPNMWEGKPSKLPL